jgi:transketolase
MLPEAVHAAHTLKEQGVSARVVSFHTVKPLDEACLRDAFARFALVATIEEHSLIGGLGSAVSEWVIDQGVSPKAFIRFGTPDKFFKKSGEQEFARHALGLTGDQIAARVLSLLKGRA